MPVTRRHAAVSSSTHHISCELPFRVQTSDSQSSDSLQSALRLTTASATVLCVVHSLQCDVRCHCCMHLQNVTY